MKPRDFGFQEDRASLCFFASTHREGLLIWVICLSIVKCPPVCVPLGKHSRYVWAVYLMSIGNLLCFQSLPLIAFQLSNKTVINWCDCSVKWHSTFIPSERKVTLSCKMTLLSSTASHPKLNYIGAYARELVTSQWPTIVLVSGWLLIESRNQTLLP